LLGALAASTQEIGLGSCVIGMLKRDPVAVAQAALTTNALSAGRLELGLGTGLGPELRSFGVDAGRPISRLEEAITVLRGLFASSAGNPFSLEGRWITLSNAFLSLPGVSPPPILLATIGERGLALAKNAGDGWIPFALSPPAYAALLSRVDPADGEFRRYLWLPTFLEGPGEDRRAEAEAVGRMYLSMAPEVLKLVVGGDAPVTLAGGATSWDPSRTREIADSLPREVALSVTLYGRPAECVETLERYAAAGCECVILRMSDATRRTTEVELFARHMLSSLDHVEVA
jgi:alkanesulfonate monooxygenase SsuD/methylene tetrahydromethanopterin reductase-like flavin-dependent oxidoreductase (luciferase family)